MASMLRTGPVYFYDQLKTRAVKRSRKMQEELPSDMKYLNINPRLANFINSLNRNKKGGQAERKQTTLAKDEKMLKEKFTVLPEIGSSTLPKNGVENTNQKLSHVITDDENLMNPFDEYKYVAPTLLYELGKLLNFFSQYEIIFPQGVVNVLNYSWQELIEGTVYTKKNCQSSKKMTADTSIAPEESEYKAPGASTALPETANIKNIKNKANTTILEHSKGKTGQEFAQSRPAGNRSPQNLAAHVPVTISFSMSKVSEDKGWIFETKDSKSEEMEWRGLFTWAVERLQLAQIQINKQLSNLNEKGLNKPLILRHYDGTKRDPVLKQKKSNKPPAFVLINGKPHIPEIKQENPSLKKLYYALTDGSSMV
ncbi:uncharacterized protein [Pyxicephalus adspersus]|uniref:uncharacterized protein n=1 Tax=Pyxicephalus adspersus TaxID=30357 RepID=UPI003B5A49A3